MQYPSIEPLETRIVPAVLSIAGPASVLEGDSGKTDLAFSWSTAGEPVTADIDYMAVTNLLAPIPAGQTSMLLPVTIFVDADSVNERLSVSIVAPNFGSLGTSAASGTIRVASLEVSVVGPVGAITEGTGGSDRDAVFRITRTAGSDINTAVSVRVSTVDGTATAAGGDYDALSGFNVSLPAGVDETTVVVTVNPDSLYEANEAFSLRIDSLEIGGASFDGIAVGTATALITNDDAVPTLSVSNATETEGSTSARALSFVVMLSNAADRDITFEYVTELTGSADAADFTQVLVPTSVTIPVGQTSKTVSIDLAGDAELEAAEQFHVRISNASFGTIADDSGTMTILDDEPVISISAPATLVEGSATNGTTNATFTVTLDKAAQENIAVRVATSDETAISAFDYDAVGTVAEKWIIIPAGTRTGTFVVPVFHDVTSELAETFSVNVVETKVGVNAALDVNGLPVGGVALPPQGFIAPAVATITDDDAIALSIADNAIVEGNSGTQTMMFMVSIPKAADRGIVLHYQITSNTAQAGVDFGGFLNSVATILPGSTSASIPVNIFSDSFGEADETFTVRIFDATVGTDTLVISDAFATGTILNDEHTVSISPTVSVAENVAGGVALVTLGLSSASSFPVTVTLALMNGTATKGTDFNDPALLNVVIPAGQITATVAIPITNDSASETNETFTVRMLTAANTELAALIESTVTILNDDAPSQMTIANVTVVELNPAGVVDEFVDMTFTVMLNRASGTAVSFDWETLAGTPFTATPGADFTAAVATTLSIAAGETTKTFVVKVKKDAIHEANETLGVRVFNVVGAELLDGATTPAVTTSRTVTGTITNDDSAPTISIADARVLEGAAGPANAEFAVTLSRATDQDVTFQWRTITGGANPAGEGVDFTGITPGAMVTILAGQTTAMLTAVLTGDVDVEGDETFLVQIVEPRLVLPSDPHVPGSGTLITGDLEAVGTIRNDDTVATIQAAVATTESDGLVEVRIPVTLSQPVPAGETATVGFEIIAGTGVGGATLSDFEIPTSTVITFAAGETMKNIIVRVKADEISELDETFSVRLRDVTSQNVFVQAGVDDTSVVTIADGDALPQISIANVGAVETAGLMTFVIKLSQKSSSPVTVMVETLEGTALSTGVSFDFTGRALEMITIPTDALSTDYTVSIRNDAEANEGIETFSIRLSSPINATLAGGDATGSIVEPNIGSLKIEDVSRVEGSNASTPAKMTFVVKRSGSTALEAVADYAIQFTGGASAVDFALPAELIGTVTIPAGLASKTFEVSIAGDALAEGNETFTVALSNLRNAFAVTEANLKATGTILEDDVTVAFQDSADLSRPKVFSTIEGNAGTSNLAFGITLNQIAATDVVVTFSVSSGTATGGTDFVIPTTLMTTIPAGQLTGMFVIPVTGDAAAESAEQFTVRIVSATGASVVAAENTRTGEIVNDDAVFRILDGARVIEGNTATFGFQHLAFQVELTDAAFAVGTNYTVDFATANGLAIAGQDYFAETGTLTFNTNGVQTVYVTVRGDTLSENDETLSLTISNPKLNNTAITAILNGTATGTIQDDEALVAIGNATVPEGDAGQQQMIFVLSMPTATTHPVTIHFSTINGTAIGAEPGATSLVGRDFQAVTAGSVTIPAGQTTAQISISILGDNVDETSSETFTVKLTSASGAAFTDDEGLGTITEDTDPLPTLSIADAQLLESDSGAPIMKFRVSLSAAANEDVTFNWSTAAGTADAGDFTAKFFVAATIPVGELFVDVEVPITADTFAEGNEKFAVSVINARRGDPYLAISDATADGTILDDDAFIHIAFADDEVAFVEDDGTTGTKARVRLDVDPVPGEFSVTYTITAPTLSTDVAASAGADYTVPTTFTKAFAAGTAAADLFIEVDLKADAIDEWDEKFVVTLVSASGVKLDATPEELRSIVTITDNDAAPTLQFADITHAENSGQARFFVRLVGNATERAITIHWETIAGTALATSDFTSLTNQTLTISNGSREEIIHVTLVNDSRDEADESFSVALNDANFTQGALSEPVVDDPVAVATIPQNDLRTAAVLGGSVVEGATGDANRLKFTIQLDAAPSATPVKVNYSTIAGTAFAGSDFLATSGQVIFQPGETTKDVFVDVVSDNVAEADETFKLAISIPADGFAVLSGNAEAVGTIDADESVFKLVNVDSPTISEGGMSRFKVVRTGATDFAATVNFAVLEGALAGALRAIAGSDFTARVGTISFATGESDSGDFGVFIDVLALNDSIAELDGEKLLVRLTSVTNGVVGSAHGESEQTVSINDNDVPPDPKVRISDAFVNEGGNLSFVVSLVNVAGAPINAAYPIRVSYQSVLGTADAADFTGGFSTAVQMISFSTGQSSITINVPTQQDSSAEQNETMTMRLLKVEKDFGGLAEILQPFYPQSSTADATGTILNDDTVITVGNVTEPEENAPNTMTFTATIPGAVSFPVSFRYKTQNGTANSADFDATEGDVIIPAGFTAATFTVNLRGDVVREANEQFTVLLTAPIDAILASATAIGTIQNDDAGPQLTLSGGSVAEGGDLIFTVSLTGEITENVTVNFATSDGTAKSSGAIQDYLAKQGTITFVPQVGVANQTHEIRVTVNGDDWKEGDETVNMALSDAVGAELLLANATSTILDGADLLIGVFLRDSSVVEGSNVVFTLEATSLPSQPFSVKVNTRTGSADSTDFAPLVDRLVTFGTSSLTTSVTVSTFNDSVFEPSERFFLDATNSSNGAGIVPGAASAQALIYNDDFRIVSKREFEFIDEDGDLVNVKVSKGALFRPNFFGQLVSSGIVTLTATGNVGGNRLDSVNFLGTGNEFAGANLFITRKSQPGFDLQTDARVNVGEIIAAQPGFASLAQGVNLGTVKIDGDLGRIIAGSNARSVGVTKLEIGSLGVVDRSSYEETQSILFGKTGSILVHGDMEGSLYVTGTNRGIGSLGSLTIQGKLLGGNSDRSGFISSSSKIGKLTFGGIVGGDGDNSGHIDAAGAIGSITALGNIVGGDGRNSGQISGKSIGTVTFTGASIIGGNGGADVSTSVGSGAVISLSSIKSVKMTGNILGGNGESSGMIFASSKVGTMSIGNVIGGEGEGSGRVRIGGDVTSFTAGTIQGGSVTNSGSVQATGKMSAVQIANILGPQYSALSSTTRAGSVIAGHMGKVSITGNITGATDSAHIGSGSLFSAGNIASLSVAGTVENTVISAAGNIGKVKIGTLRFAEILAGYSAGSTDRGALTNTDAQIGAVVVNEFIGSSIVAGVSPGVDNVFGQTNDIVPFQNNARVISKIASITIKKSLTTSSPATGIVAQSIGPVKVAGASVSFALDPVALPGSQVFINVV